MRRRVAWLPCSGGQWEGGTHSGRGRQRSMARCTAGCRAQAGRHTTVTRPPTRGATPTECDEPLVQQVGGGGEPLVHDHLCLARRSRDLLHVPADVVTGHALRRVDVVPDAQGGAALGHHHVRVGHPLGVVAVGQQRVLALLHAVVQVQAVLLVAEQQQGAAGVQLQPIHAGVVRHVGHRGARVQVHHAHRLPVQQVSRGLGGCGRAASPRTAAAARAPCRAWPLVDANAERVGGQVLGAEGPEGLHAPVLHQRRLPAAVHQRHGRVLEVEAGAVPLGGGVVFAGRCA
jgi:hypothetical protein